MTTLFGPFPLLIRLNRELGKIEKEFDRLKSSDTKINNENVNCLGCDIININYEKIHELFNYTEMKCIINFIHSNVITDFTININYKNEKNIIKIEDDLIKKINVYNKLVLDSILKYGFFALSFSENDGEIIPTVVELNDSLTLKYIIDKDNVINYYLKNSHGSTEDVIENIKIFIVDHPEKISEYSLKSKILDCETSITQINLMEQINMKSFELNVKPKFVMQFKDSIRDFDENEDENIELPRDQLSIFETKKIHITAQLQRMLQTNNFYTVYLDSILETLKQKLEKEMFEIDHINSIDLSLFKYEISNTKNKSIMAKIKYKNNLIVKNTIIPDIIPPFPSEVDIKPIENKNNNKLIEREQYERRITNLSSMFNVPANEIFNIRTGSRQDATMKRSTETARKIRLLTDQYRNEFKTYIEYLIFLVSFNKILDFLKNNGEYDKIIESLNITNNKSENYYNYDDDDDDGKYDDSTSSDDTELKTINKKLEKQFINEIKNKIEVTIYFKTDPPVSEESIVNWWKEGLLGEDPEIAMDLIEGIVGDILKNKYRKSKNKKNLKRKTPSRGDDSNNNDKDQDQDQDQDEKKQKLDN